MPAIDKIGQNYGASERIYRDFSGGNSSINLSSNLRHLSDMSYSTRNSLLVALREIFRKSKNTNNIVSMLKGAITNPNRYFKNLNIREKRNVVEFLRQLLKLFTGKKDNTTYSPQILERNHFLRFALEEDKNNTIRKNSNVTLIEGNVTYLKNGAIRRDVSSLNIAFDENNKIDILPINSGSEDEDDIFYDAIDNSINFSYDSNSSVADNENNISMGAEEPIPAEQEISFSNTSINEQILLPPQNFIWNYTNIVAQLINEYKENYGYFPRKIEDKIMTYLNNLFV